MSTTTHHGSIGMLRIAIPMLGHLALTLMLPTWSKCKSVRKPRADLPDTLVDLTSAFKYFQILPGPPGALQCALRLFKSILRCSWKHMQLWTWHSGCYKIWLIGESNFKAAVTSAQVCGRLREQLQTSAQLCGRLVEQLQTSVQLCGRLSAVSSHLPF